MSRYTMGETLDKTFSYKGKRVAKRWAKRTARRTMRRLGRLLGEDAPKKYIYSGYFW